MRVMPYLVQWRLGGVELLRGNELVPGMLRSDRMSVQTYKKKAEMAQSTELSKRTGCAAEVLRSRGGCLLFVRSGWTMRYGPVFARRVGLP